MVFIGITIAVWLLYGLILKKRKADKFRFYDMFLPLVFFSIIVSIDLGLTYLSSYHVTEHDGIIIDGVLVYWLIGDDRRSTSMFKGFYNKSVIVSVVLLSVYSLLKIVEE